jgi:hypothetical protein
VIRSSPAQSALQLTNLPTRLWINPAEWVPESKTATVPGESVTATATPVSVTWHPGDGSTVTCQGAGAPYTSADNPGSASPDCGHTYTSSSAGQPDGAFRATATITWDVTWRGAGGAGGVLPPLFTTAVAAFRVAESQALDTSGGTCRPPGASTVSRARAGTVPARTGPRCPRPSRPAPEVKSDGRRTTAVRRARTGGKAARGISQVHERTMPGTPDSSNSRLILPLWYLISGQEVKRVSETGFL